VVRNERETGRNKNVARRRPAVRNRFDELIAFCALAVSLGSLLIAYVETRATRQLVQASSLPHLSLASTFNGTPGGHWQSVARSLENDGVGPADVRWVEITLDGKPYPSFEDLLRQCCGVTRPQRTATLTNRMIRPGSSVDYVSVAAADGQQTAIDVYAGLLRSNRIATRICYCSVFDDCWEVRSVGNGRPTPLRSCPGEENAQL
jgi:hypothetical protein